LIGAEVYRQLESAQSPYVVFVSPLLIEAGQHAICDRIVVVDVPESVQLQRTVQRDENDEEQVRNIINSQADRQQRLDVATDVIENSGSLEALDQKVVQLHQQFLLLARQSSDND
jgi:dephospho-CoA kinase